MKPKHIQIRIEQCLALAKASNCSRRKFGALLLDPERNVILADGYNGGPRGGGDLCDGDWCVRDGIKPEEVTVDGHPLDGDCYVRLRGKMLPLEDGRPLYWEHQAIEYRDRLLAQFPPIASGTHVEVGCVHAEMNVLCNAAAQGTPTKGAWLIVTGEPCVMCAKLIHHAGITKVIVVKGGFVGGDAGPVYLRKNGVEVQYEEGPQDPRAG